MGQFLAGVDSASFARGCMRQLAVLQLLVVVGEAASRLSTETRARSLAISWSDVVAFRNVAVHAYFAVDWMTVWNAAVGDLPMLCGQVDELLLRLDEGQ